MVAARDRQAEALHLVSAHVRDEVDRARQAADVGQRRAAVRADVDGRRAGQQAVVAGGGRRQCRRNRCRKERVGVDVAGSPMAALHDAVGDVRDGVVVVNLCTIERCVAPQDAVDEQRAAHTQFAVVVHPAAILGAVAADGDVCQRRAAHTELAIVVQPATILGVVAADDDIGQRRAAHTELTIVVQPAARRGDVGVDEQICQSRAAQVAFAVAVAVDAATAESDLNFVGVAARDDEAVQYGGGGDPFVHYAVQVDHAPGIVGRRRVAVDVAVEDRRVRGPVPLCAQRLGRRKAAVELHVVVEDVEAFSAAVVRMFAALVGVVGPLRHPDFVICDAVGVCLVQRLLQRLERSCPRQAVTADRHITVDIISHRRRRLRLHHPRRSQGQEAKGQENGRQATLDGDADGARRMNCDRGTGEDKVGKGAHSLNLYWWFRTKGDWIGSGFTVARPIVRR